VEFLELSRDVEGEEGSEIDAAEKFDIDLAVMTGELARLLGDLVQAFGGESVPQAAAA
jgi:DNA recombination-dependent growth factor C